MKTYPAKFYNDRRLEDASPENIVKTIKAQCYVKGKSGKWINYVNGRIEITHSKITGIITDDKALVYYEADKNLFHAIGTNFGYIFEP